MPSAETTLKALGVALAIVRVSGCGPMGSPPSHPDNSAAKYIGSSACRACHPSLGVHHDIHGHSQALKPVEADAPIYPDAAPDAGVPRPPAGMEWFDVSYVIGGYLKAAEFVDVQGFRLVHGDTGRPFFYHLRHRPSGTGAGFDEVGEAGLDRQPYDYERFRRHTTGAESVSDNGGRRQGNRPGIEGTWVEEGVQCEACHGPGSLHVPNPQLGNIRVDTSADACGDCHGDCGGELRAQDGFIIGNQQLGELRVSPHRDFTCTVCHDPHASTAYDAERGLRNGCRDCHTAIGLARHEGKIFAQGDYVERLRCESCHMSFASKLASMAADSVTGGLGGRIGDTRTHVVYINPAPDDYTALFNAEGDRVVAGANGRVAMTLDYVCLRCHNGLGSAFELTLPSAAEIARGIHSRQ